MRGYAHHAGNQDSEHFCHGPRGALDLYESFPLSLQLSLPLVPSLARSDPALLPSAPAGTLENLMESVYASKEKFDGQCVAQRVPLRTLSKYLDEFLLYKYGLTSLAEEHAAVVRRAVHKFRKDNGVRVFGMALRNKVGFRLLRGRQAGAPRS